MNKTKQPLFHIVKRGDMPWHFSWCIRATAIILALVCCSLISTFVTSENPVQIFAYTVNTTEEWVPTGVELKENYFILLCILIFLCANC